VPDTTPTVDGLVTFGQDVAGIDVEVMPADDPGWADALTFAQANVPRVLNRVNPVIYTSAVYNWAISLIIQYQSDQEGQNFFALARKGFGVNNWLPGPVDAASDNGTSQHTSLGKGMQNLTFSDMQRAKDPYGRQALAYMQDLGNLWGLT
jgi:hypothetical protein